jgi:cyanate permease
MRKGNVPFVAGWRMNLGEWTIDSLLKFLTWIYESLRGGKTIYATLGG